MKLAPPTPHAAERVTMKYFVPEPDDGPPGFDDHDFPGDDTAGRIRSIRFTSFADVHLTDNARYVVKGIIPATGLIVVWGPPKCGKSFFVFDLVAHVAAGWDYRARRVKQDPVIYFALEGQQGFEARIAAFKQAHQIGAIPFYLSADRILLPQDGRAIIQSIRQQFSDVVPGVVVLDTLNRSITGSENDPADMSQYVRAADAIREAFDCVVIVIHHCGTEGTRPRGHTSLTGAADAQIAVRRDDQSNIIATVEFMKDGPEGDEIASRLEYIKVGTTVDGDEITSCVVWPAEARPSKPKVTGQNALALKILYDLIVDQGEIVIHPQIPPQTRTCSEKIWRQECYAKMFADGTDRTSKQKGFVRAAKALQNASCVGKYEDYVWPIGRPDKPGHARTSR
jgi:hypothetical protein